MSGSEFSTPKRCSTCREVFGDVAANFYRDRNSKDGYVHRCKTCQKASNRNASEASKEKSRKRSRERMRRLRRENPEYVKQLKKESKERHPEKAKSRDRANYLKNRQRYLEQARAYFAANRERLNELRREYYRTHNEAERKRIRKAQDPGFADRVRSQLRNYYASKLAADGSHTADDVRRLYEEQGGRCFYCDKSVGDAYHVDHVIPLSRGGSNGPDNLVVACPFCNQSKNDRLPEEWYLHRVRDERYNRDENGGTG